jgi:hypothetical protein
MECTTHRALRLGDILADTSELGRSRILHLAIAIDDAVDGGDEVIRRGQRPRHIGEERIGSGVELGKETS